MADPKGLTPENWTTVDPASLLFDRMDAGSSATLPGSGLAQRFLSIGLATDVPREIHDMWRVAQGVLVYGWFFYPLYALGEDQLRRVADSAVLIRYQQLDGPVRQDNGKWPELNRRLDWLIKHGHVDRALRPGWDAIRKLRNYGSHADYARLAMPGDALRTTEIVAREIDALFANGDSLSEG